MKKIFNEIKENISYMCRNITPIETKEDCIQEAWFEVLKRINKYDAKKGSVSTFFKLPILKGIEKILNAQKKQSKLNNIIKDSYTTSYNLKHLYLNFDNILEKTYYTLVLKDNIITHRQMCFIFNITNILSKKNTHKLRKNLIKKIKDSYYED